MMLQIDEITRLFHVYGTAVHGAEGVSHLQHALQCAQLAQEAGSPRDLVVAALLHDLGSLLAAYAEPAPAQADDGQQLVAVRFLHGLFPDSILEPIRLHIDARRYCSAVDHDYWAYMPTEARQRLERRGGPFSSGQVREFLDTPFAWDAIAICRWDDMARNAFARPPSWSHFLPALRSASLLSEDGIDPAQAELRSSIAMERLFDTAITRPRAPALCR